MSEHEHIRTFTICDTEFSVVPLSDTSRDEIRKMYPAWKSDDVMNLFENCGMDAVIDVLISGLVTDDIEHLIEKTKRFVEKMVSIKDPEALEKHLTALMQCVVYIAFTPTAENLKTQLKTTEIPSV